MSDLLWQKGGVAVERAHHAFPRRRRRRARSRVLPARHRGEQGARRRARCVSARQRRAKPSALERELDALARGFRRRTVRARRSLRRRTFGDRGASHRTSRRCRPQGAYRAQPQRSGSGRNALVAEGEARRIVSPRAARSRRYASIAPDREALPLPGYTHLQRAVVSSTAIWFAGFAEAFIDNARRALDTLRVDRCEPARHGGRLWRQPSAGSRAHDGGARASRACRSIRSTRSCRAASSRSRRSMRSARPCSICAGWPGTCRCSRPPSSASCTLPDEYTTGSSIMPNKRNPDVVELMRATYASVAAARTEIEQLLSLPSGYQRDLHALLRHGLGQALLGLRLRDLLERRDRHEAPARPRRLVLAESHG